MSGQLRRFAVSLALAAAATTLAGCGSSPEQTFFALAPSHGTAQAGLPHAIEVRRIAIPAYLDRPGIVRGVVRFELEMAANERWGAPLDEMLGRVLASDLQQRAPGSIVFTETGAITIDPDATIEIDVERFEVDAGGEVTFVANVAIERGLSHAASGARAIELRKAPRGPGTGAIVEAMSELLGELADQVAGMLRSG